MNHRIIHFEIPSDHPSTAITFFETVFNWKFSQFGEEPYWFINTGDTSEEGINGGLIQKRDPNQPLTNSIHTENIDETLLKISASGGEVVVPKFAIPGMGWAAYFKDPDGNIFGLHQADNNANK